MRDDLMVRLRADPRALEAGLDQAARRLKSFGDDGRRQIDQVAASAERLRQRLSTIDHKPLSVLGEAAGGAGDRLRDMGAGLLAALSVGGLLAMTKGAMDAVGGLGELADQMGVTAQSLQVYQYAATQAGLSAEQMTALLAKLTAQIGQAASGDAAVVARFEALGVAFRDASGHARATEDVLRDVADAMAAASTPAEQAAIAFRLFGEMGQKLVPMLKGGAAGLDEFARAATAAGAVVTDDLIAAADEAADKIAAMQHAWQKFTQATAGRIAPGVTAVLDALNFAAEGFSGLEGRSLERLRYDRDSVAGKVAAAEEDFQRHRDSNSPFTEDRARTWADLSHLLDAIDRRIAELSNPDLMAPPLAAFGVTHIEFSPVPGLPAGASAAAAGKRSGGPSASAPPPSLPAGWQEYDRLEAEDRAADAAAGMRTFDPSALSDMQEYNDLLERGAEITRELMTQEERWAEERQELDELLASGAISAETHARGMQRIVEETEWAARATDRLKATAEDLGAAFASSLEDVVLQGGSLKDMLQGLEQDMLRIIMRRLVTEPLMQAIDVGIGALFGGGRAAGGPVRAGTRYLVGESGPEMFVPRVPGQMVPNSGLTGDSPVSIQIIDQRSRMAPPVQVQNRRGSAGERQLRIMVRDAVHRSIIAGEMDTTMGSAYGLSRRAEP